VAESASQSRSMMWLFVNFGASALIMASIGIYGIVSYWLRKELMNLECRVGTAGCPAAPLTEPDLRASHPALWIDISPCQAKLAGNLR